MFNCKLKISTLTFLTIFFITGCTKEKATIETAKYLAFTNVNLIDGVSDSVRTNQTILIEKETGKIKSIFSDNITPIPPESVRADLTGKTMMAGLIEGHFHLASMVKEQTQFGQSSMEKMFQQGITTVRDMAGNGIALKALQQLGANKDKPYPKIHFACLVAGKNFINNDERVQESAGNGVAGEEPWFQMLDDNTNVTNLISQAKAFGCSGLKLYADISSSNAKRIIAAEQLDFPVWSHGTLFNASPWDIIDSHSFSHADFLNFVTIKPVPSFIEFYTSDYVEIFDLNTISSTKMQQYFSGMRIKKTVLDATLLVYDAAGADEQDVVQFAHAATKAAYNRNVLIGAGVDAFNDDVDGSRFFLLEEINKIKAVTGMSNLEALQTATINNAIALGIADQYGTVEVGKMADLIVLDKNPLEDLNNLKSVISVIKDGVLFEIQ